jgi:hypothetical protein
MTELALMNDVEKRAVGEGLSVGTSGEFGNTSSDERDQDSALRRLPDSIWDWWERLNRVTHTPARSGLITRTAP